MHFFKSRTFQFWSKTIHDHLIFIMDHLKYLKRNKFNTGFILFRSNLVALILVPWEILEILAWGPLGHLKVLWSKCLYGVCMYGVCMCGVTKFVPRQNLRTDVAINIIFFNRLVWMRGTQRVEKKLKKVWKKGVNS